VVNDLNLDSAEATATQITNAGGIALAVQGDVSDPTDVDCAYALGENAWGHITLAVNNAGIVTQSSLAEMEIADFDRMIAVHLRGCFICCRHAIGPMLEAGSGVIINIASQLGQIGGVELAHYAAAKAGIIGLYSESLKNRRIG
jgi:3-oxoacyl-[acyl-carrier protein] reductase